MARIERHPIVSIDRGDPFRFTFGTETVTAYPGEMISSALSAHGIRIFGRHPRDGAPQGLFCANGQCAQCLVLADGRPVKACMTPATPGLHVEPLLALPELPAAERPPTMREVETIDTSVLILGGGPAGLSAAAEIAAHGVDVHLVDDKRRLGGKLVLQTHRFFGSIDAVHAGTRGIDIAERLAAEVRALSSVELWMNSTALAVFSDGLVGVLRDGASYVLVRPKVLLVATGAREKSLSFPGNTLPGVYGAGAFQTLVNRDLVRPAERLFIVGGGNVGLIAGYHALQAGIDVVGLVEALPECGGYKVHKDKLVRMGVPVHTSHTIVSAWGEECVQGVTIAKVDERFQTIPGTERSFECDTVLIAVGLDPVNEFYDAARRYSIPAFAAGDAEEIAEASAAIFAGRIRGREILHHLGVRAEAIPDEWHRTAEILRSHPGASVAERPPANETGVFPVLHCTQEIPCNPCTSVCPRNLIRIDGDDIRRVPRYVGEEVGRDCVGCERCVAICPGLAITLVDFRDDADQPTVTIPYEFGPDRLRAGDVVTVLDSEGGVLGELPVAAVRAIERNDRTVLISLRAPRALAKRIAGIRVQPPAVGAAVPEPGGLIRDEAIICRCERVTAGEIREQIRAGCRDLNEIKAVTRAGMGACGGKTCRALILRLFREEGIPPETVVGDLPRPLFVEVPLGSFAGVTEEG